MTEARQCLTEDANFTGISGLESLPSMFEGMATYTTCEVAPYSSFVTLTCVAATEPELPHWEVTWESGITSCEGINRLLVF